MIISEDLFSPYRIRVTLDKFILEESIPGTTDAGDAIKYKEVTASPDLAKVLHTIVRRKLADNTKNLSLKEFITLQKELSDYISTSLGFTETK